MTKDAATPDAKPRKGWKAEGNGNIARPAAKYTPIKIFSTETVEATADAAIQPIMAFNAAEADQGKARQVLEAFSESYDALRTELLKANRDVVGRPEIEVNQALDKAVEREIADACARSKTRKAAFEQKYVAIQEVVNPNYRRSYSSAVKTPAASGPFASEGGREV